LQYYIGCSGWSYSAWQGPFYPSNLDSTSSDWLPFYASVFNYVESDSSFYRTPNVFTAKNWFNKTPEFTAKAFDYYGTKLAHSAVAVMVVIPVVLGLNSSILHQLAAVLLPPETT
jgi:uncharacterized protein YecE (DUF72 family)